MRYRDLLVVTKWLVLFVAGLALDNAFGNLFDTAVKDHVVNLRAETGHIDYLGDTCLHFPEEIFVFMLLLYFVLNAARYLSSAFWEFIPLFEKKRLEDKVNWWVGLRFAIFALLQIMVIAWQGKAISDPFAFFYLLAFLFATDIAWGTVSRFLIVFLGVALDRPNRWWHASARTALDSFAENNTRAGVWLKVACADLAITCLLIYLLWKGKSPFDHRVSEDLRSPLFDFSVIFLFVVLSAIPILDFWTQRDSYTKIFRFLFDFNQGTDQKDETKPAHPA